MSDADRRTAGFKERTRLAAARERLLDRVAPHGRTESVPLEDADGRALAESVTAARPVPGYDRAARDGYAVRARDTFGASDRSPAVLRRADAGTDAGEARVEAGAAVRVRTGSELPDGADAVVMVERAEAVGDDLEVFDAVSEGENVGAAGEDVAAGQRLYDAGHRLRPADLGLLKSVGVGAAEVAEKPRIAVLPTGAELVQADPRPGEVVETNGLTVSRYVRRWGGDPAHRDVVSDEEAALRAAIRRGVEGADAVVTTGGSSVGERDLVPDVVDDLGEVFVHGVALKPGHSVALGAVDGTPVLTLPGYPVACIVNAVQFLRPTVHRLAGADAPPHSERRARLRRKVASEPGIRTFARVTVEEDDEEVVAEPTRASGAGVLSSVALADGWVVVPEGSEGVDAGATVAVETWEWSA